MTGAARGVAAAADLDVVRVRVRVRVFTGAARGVAAADLDVRRALGEARRARPAVQREGLGPRPAARPVEAQAGGELELRVEAALVVRARVAVGGGGVALARQPAVGVAEGHVELQVVAPVEAPLLARVEAQALPARVVHLCVRWVQRASPWLAPPLILVACSWQAPCGLGGRGGGHRGLWVGTGDRFERRARHPVVAEGGVTLP